MNKQQLIKVVLATKTLEPRTMILELGQTLFLGGLARLDYVKGKMSAYFTVFASGQLPLHTTNTTRADQLYARHAGEQLLKVCLCIVVVSMCGCINVCK